MSWPTVAVLHSMNQCLWTNHLCERFSDSLRQTDRQQQRIRTCNNSSVFFRHMYCSSWERKKTSSSNFPRMVLTDSLYNIWGVTWRLGRAERKIKYQKPIKCWSFLFSYNTMVAFVTDLWLLQVYMCLLRQQHSLLKWWGSEVNWRMWRNTLWLQSNKFFPSLLKTFYLYVTYNM